MQDLVTVLSNEDGIQISLDVQQDAVLQIGEMMQEIQEEAYMNGENWAIFFQYYLEQYAPDLLEGLESDAEAGMYAAYYETATPKNHQTACRFAQRIIGISGADLSDSEDNRRRNRMGLKNPTRLEEQDSTATVSYCPV